MGGQCAAPPPSATNSMLASVALHFRLPYDSCAAVQKLAPFGPRLGLLGKIYPIIRPHNKAFTCWSGKSQPLLSRVKLTLAMSHCNFPKQSTLKFCYLRHNFSHRSAFAGLANDMTCTQAQAHMFSALSPMRSKHWTAILGRSSMTRAVLISGPRFPK